MACALPCYQGYPISFPQVFPMNSVYFCKFYSFLSMGKSQMDIWTAYERCMGHATARLSLVKSKPTMSTRNTQAFVCFIRAAHKVLLSI